MPRTNPFERDLDRNAANYTPLTPLSLIARTAYTYPEHLAVLHGDRRYSWAETYTRSRDRVGAIAGRCRDRRYRSGHGGEHAGDGRRAFRRAMTGCVLNTLNTRLDAEAIAFMLEHGGAKVLVTDTEYSPTVEKALRNLPRSRS